MVKNNRVQIVLILLFFLGAMVFAQDKPTDEDQKLRKEILAAYQSEGEQGLRDFVRKQKDKISNKFIVGFAQSGRKERNEEWLKVCEIISEEKKDEKTLADVLYQTGEYFRLISYFKKADDYLDKALSIYLKTNDPVGQGNVYLRKGIIHVKKGKNSRALEMYDKALHFFEKAGDSVGQGNVYLTKGNIYLYRGESSKAMEMYDKSLPFFEKVGHLVGQGNIFFCKGEIYSNLGDKVKALKIYDSAFACYEKAESSIGMANVYLKKGMIYSSTRGRHEAMEMYKKALPLFEKAKELRGQGAVYLRKGKIYSNLGEQKNALNMYNKALSIFEKAGEHLGKGTVYKNKGDIYLNTYEYSKAQIMYDKALAFYIKERYAIGQGNVYLRKGIIYFRQGDNSKSLDMYNKALQFFMKAGDILGKGNFNFSKGEIYFRTGEYSKALKMYNKAMCFFVKTGNIVNQGNVFHTKGNMYLITGDNSRALEMYDKALLLYMKIGATLNQGNILASKGAIYYYTGDFLNALSMYDEALLIFEKVRALLRQGQVYSSKGDIYSSMDENPEALEMYDKALPFFVKTEYTIGQGDVYKGNGDIYLRTGDNYRALEMYNKALSFYKKAEDIESVSNVLHAKAKVVKKKKALELFEKAISNLEKVRTQIAFSEMKRTFLEKVYKQYEEMVLFTLENKYYKKGFKYAESMKSRVFLDRMAEELVRLKKGLAPDLNEKRDNLVAKLSILSKQIHKTAGGKDDKKLQELKEKYRKTEDEFDELLIKIRLNNPLYASVRYPQPISVRDLQKDVLKKGEILVRYFISLEKLYVFLVSKKKFKVVPLKVTKEEIESAAERYLLAIKENNSNDIKRFGRAIYEKLFKPLEKRLKKTRDIIVIPDGHLATIPFESIVIDKKESGRPVFLLEKYRIKYIQSASILSVLRKHYRRDSETKDFIGFGDPVYDYKKFKQEKIEQAALMQQAPKNGDEIKEIHRTRYARAGGVLPRLQGSGEEVKTIARHFKVESQKCAVHIRDKATEENAKVPGLKDFDFIHFACHGLLNDDFQCLVLSQDIPEAKDDGYFTLNEVMNCDYNAKLVVLSGCETGSGKMERAEGVTGLTRAVMYAGTPAVVASLWKVDDTATKELMVNFYRNLIEKNLSKTESLRQAKLELLKAKHYASPIFWSAFVLYGE